MRLTIAVRMFIGLYRWRKLSREVSNYQDDLYIETFGASIVQALALRDSRHFSNEIYKPVVESVNLSGPCEFL